MRFTRNSVGVPTPAGLPLAVAAGEVPVSTGAGTAYAAESRDLLVAEGLQTIADAGHGAELLSLLGAVPQGGLTADLSAGGHRLRGLLFPINPDEPAPLSYIDTVAPAPVGADSADAVPTFAGFINLSEHTAKTLVFTITACHPTTGEVAFGLIREVLVSVDAGATPTITPIDERAACVPATGVWSDTRGDHFLVDVIGPAALRLRVVGLAATPLHWTLLTRAV